MQIEGSYADRGAILGLMRLNFRATAAAIHSLREKYSRPIVGMEPPVKPAVARHLLRRMETELPPRIAAEASAKFFTSGEYL